MDLSAQMCGAPYNPYNTVFFLQVAVPGESQLKAGVIAVALWNALAALQVVAVVGLLVGAGWFLRRRNR